MKKRGNVIGDTGGRYEFGRPKDPAYFTYRKQSMECRRCGITTVHQYRDGRWICIACARE